MDLFQGADPSTIGNSTSVVPATVAAKAPDGVGQPKTVVKFQPSGIGGFRTTMMTDKQESDTRVLTCSIFAQPNPSNTTGGPLTGIAIFGSGAGAPQTVEFDIPVLTSTFDLASLPFSGGVQISVPATSLEVRARNDASLIPTSLLPGTPPSVSIGGAKQTPIIVTGSIAAGTKPTYAKAFKTVWMFNNAAAPLAPGGQTAVLVPPFATSVRVARSPHAGTTSGQLTVLLDSENANYDMITIPAGTSCPEIPLSGSASILIVTNTDGAISDDAIVAIFTLGI